MLQPHPFKAGTYAYEMQIIPPTGRLLARTIAFYHHPNGNAHTVISWERNGVIFEKIRFYDNKRRIQKIQHYKTYPNKNQQLVSKLQFFPNGEAKRTVFSPFFGVSKRETFFQGLRVMGVVSHIQTTMPERSLFLLRQAGAHTL